MNLFSKHGGITKIDRQGGKRGNGLSIIPTGKSAGEGNKNADSKITLFDKKKDVFSIEERNEMLSEILKSCEERKKNKGKGFFNEFANRNSVHQDVSGLVSKGKMTIRLIIDSFKGVKDDTGFNWFEYPDRGGTIYHEGTRQTHNNAILENKGIYKKGNSGNDIKFIKINDKEKYKKEMKDKFVKEFLKFNGEFSEMKSEFQDKISDLYELGIIDINKISELLTTYLRFRGKEILRLFSDDSVLKIDYRNLGNMDLNIIAWNLIEGNNIFFLKYFYEKQFRTKIGNWEIETFIKLQPTSKDLVNFMIHQLLGIIPTTKKS